MGDSYTVTLEFTVKQLAAIFLLAKEERTRLMKQKESGHIFLPKYFEDDVRTINEIIEKINNC